MNWSAWMDGAGHFLVALARLSWQASVVVILVLLAQWFLRRQLTPRWRHALWLLVVIRLVLPSSLESPLSLFNWLPFRTSGVAELPRQPAPTGQEFDTPHTSANSLRSPAQSPGWREALLGAWLLGGAGLTGYLMISMWQLRRRIRLERPVTEGGVLDLLEDCKQAMAVRTPLTLIETAAVRSPSLFGFIRPRLLLPSGLTRSFSRSELRHVFLHELAHVKRGDIALNWLAIALLVLHWFNPFVWLAFHRMRVDGEMACDALALSQTDESKSYGQTIIKLLEQFSRPAASPGLVGILENKSYMKTRIHMIASFKKTSRWPVVTTAALALIGLVALTDAQSQPGAVAAGGRTASPADPKAPPAIIATSPRAGETDVDPTITGITVTFDRDMAGGFSWTGGGPEYPPAAEGQKAHWRDKRTCVFPVKLERGRFYRVGINSTSYRNFRSADGVPVQPSALYFTTEGASEELKRRAQKPQIVKIEPLNGAMDVDPSLTELRITFDVPMGGGFSWTGGGPEFPAIPEGRKAFWTSDQKTCVLPVKLERGHDYRLGLNSPSHKNFQSAGGVPLDPVAYTFRTRE